MFISKCPFLALKKSPKNTKREWERKWLVCNPCLSFQASRFASFSHIIHIWSSFTHSRMNPKNSRNRRKKNMDHFTNAWVCSYEPNSQAPSLSHPSSMLFLFLSNFLASIQPKYLSFSLMALLNFWAPRSGRNARMIPTCLPIFLSLIPSHCSGCLFQR